MYPLATLAIAGVSLVLSTFFAFRSLSRSASSDWVEQLEKRIELCESDRATLHRQIDGLQEENARLRTSELELLRRLIRLEGGT